MFTNLKANNIRVQLISSRFLALDLPEYLDTRIEKNKCIDKIKGSFYWLWSMRQEVEKYFEEGPLAWELKRVWK